jgi:hypothetical protein
VGLFDHVFLTSKLMQYFYFRSRLQNEHALTRME